LCDVLQECDPAVKQDQPTLHLLLILLLITYDTNSHTQKNVTLCSKLHFVLLKLQATALILI